MGIKDLPNANKGVNFRATAVAGSFQRKLSGATRYGDLKNLRDNQKAIVGAVKKYQGVIRTKGGLSRLQRLTAWRQIKASDKTITKEDRREIKQILSHLGRGAAAPTKKIAAVQTACPSGRPPAGVKKEKPAVPVSRRARDTDYEKYQFGGARVGVNYSEREKSVGIDKPDAGISASDKAGNANVTVFKPIKPDNFADGSDSAALSINQKK